MTNRIRKITVTSSAEALLHSAAATIPELDRQITLMEDQLSVLLGQNPDRILHGNSSFGYQSGNASYSEVLQERQQLFPTENALVQTRLNQLLAVVQLYRALGGGWQN